jgi:hypothetical protein
MEDALLPAGDLNPPPGLPIGDAVRSSCAAVAEQARFVRIQLDALPDYARELTVAHLTAPEIDPAYHVLADPATTAAFFLTLDSINFGSGYFPTMRKRAGLSGYFTVALSLKEAFERDGPWRAEHLAALTALECAAVFGQAPEFPLMPLFARALNDLGRLLLASYQGDPGQLVRAAEGSAERFAYLLTAMPYFRDVATYNGYSVSFYKRAQLAAADLSLAFASPRVRANTTGSDNVNPSDAQPLFRDLDRLTIFADNLVPHVLRVDGLLHYDPDLLARIDAEVPIPTGSPEEIEIRACAVHMVELLKAELARRGQHVTSTQLDYFLWTRGGGVHYKAQPRHRSPSVYY